MGPVQPVVALGDRPAGHPGIACDPHARPGEGNTTRVTNADVRLGRETSSEAALREAADERALHSLANGSSTTRTDGQPGIDNDERLSAD